MGGFERRMADLIFWFLFLLSAFYVICAVVGITVSGVYAMRAAALYIRAAKEEWIYGMGAWSQFINTQRLYRNAVMRESRTQDDAAFDPDQEYLNTYGRGRESVKEGILRFGKKLVYFAGAGMIWLPAAAIHSIVLLFGAVFHRLGC